MGLPAAGRDLVTARWEYWFGDARRAENLYRQLTDARPTDVESWFELGEVLFHAGPWMGRSLAEAEEPLRHVIALNPRHIAAMAHLARVAAFTRWPAMLDSLSEKVALLDPAHTRNLEMRALQSGLAPEPSKLRQLLRDLSLAQDRGLAGAIAERAAVYTGNLAMAQQIAADPPRKPLMVGWAWSHSNATARLFRATLLEKANRCRDALPWLDAVAEDIGGSPLLLPNVHLTRANCLERMGRHEDAATEYQLYVSLRRSGDPDQGKIR